MFIIAAVVCILLLVLAGSNMFLAEYNPDELSNMGIQQK
jgi:hypothetical protein